MVTLKTIKRAIDTVTESQCNGFVKAAIRETMHLTGKRVTNWLN